MRHARENHLRGYYVEEAQRAGTVLWVTPPNEFDRYVLIGDPARTRRLTGTAAWPSCSR